MRDFQLMTELPGWWIVFCLLLGVLYAFFLYRKDSSLDSIHPWLRRLLFGLRAFLVFGLALLLLSPLIRTFFRDKEKPIIVIAQDNSESIVLNKDSSFYRNQYKDKLNQLVADLKSKYDVKTVSFGDKITDDFKFSFDEKQTDMSDLLDQLDNRYGNRNVGAVIIASDGLFNRGSSPFYAASGLKVPFYTIALGDTTVQKDLLISKVNCNKTAYLGNNFPMEITVNARQCSGLHTTLTVKQDSSVVYTKEIICSGNRYNQIVPLVLEAKKKGLVHYKISLSAISGEMTTANNERDVYVEIAESKQKVLIIADAPHPDIGALKSTIESNQNYEVAVVMAEKFSGTVNEYNLIIFHNLPSEKHGISEVVKQAKAAKVSMWFIAGLETSGQLFNSLSIGMELNQTIDKSNAVQPKLNADFSLFTISEGLRTMIPQFPPLLAPFGRFRSTANNSVLFYQQIGSVATDQPLQVFKSDDDRIGVLCGEGIWRWKQIDFSVNENFNAFSEWVIKSVQNLSIKEEKTHFRLISKNNFAENEPVTFEAEVYNDSYELITSPDVNLVITGKNNKSFPFNFSKTNRSYNLDAGYFPTGDYSYKATVKIGEKLFSNNGQFTITRLQAEQSETVADHNLMYALANKNGGEMVYPSAMEQLSKKLNDRKDIKTISFSHYKVRDLIDMKIVFFILLALLTLEWFLRKRAGSY